MDPAAYGEELGGSQELYLPERLFTTSSIPVKFPQSDYFPKHLPFPVPPERFLPPSVIPSSRFQAVNPLPLRTYDRSPQAVAPQTLPKAIEGLAENVRLRTLKRSICLWDHLKDYTEPTAPMNTWKASLDAAGPDDILCIPSAAQQAKAVVDLLYWTGRQSAREESLASCELSIDDAVSSQLLDPIDMLLQVRTRK